ncbi:hypothetical protein RJ639_033271 [Escallonia herrerae]|uniref:Uncharacterized protein n=1 Tax=Escallonia herrerae TaxID=1293975 RepID=A0AA88WTZ9_9ASTE|nr:hypothetical protein RJ639_033271 [Escallonia herrerae]
MVMLRLESGSPNSDNGSSLARGFSAEMVQKAMRDVKVVTFPASSFFCEELHPPMNTLYTRMATSETNPESGPVNPNVQHNGGTVYATPYVASSHGFVGLEDAPDLGENPDRQTVAAVDAWKHSNFLCKNYILNGLDNALYNVYSPMVNAKALWESLERKYKTEDAGSKKFVVGKFLDFKMVDSKTVISQVQEFQLILHDIHAEGMHKRKEMKLEDLIVRLRIEEDNRQSEKKADVLPLYLGRLSSRTVSTVAGRISLKDSESNSRLGSPLLFV